MLESHWTNALVLEMGTSTVLYSMVKVRINLGLRYVYYYRLKSYHRYSTVPPRVPAAIKIGKAIRG